MQTSKSMCLISCAGLLVAIPLHVFFIHAIMTQKCISLPAVAGFSATNTLPCCVLNVPLLLSKARRVYPMLLYRHPLPLPRKKHNHCLNALVLLVIGMSAVLSHCALLIQKMQGIARQQCVNFCDRRMRVTCPATNSLLSLVRWYPLLWPNIYCPVTCIYNDICVFLHVQSSLSQHTMLGFASFTQTSLKLSVCSRVRTFVP